MARSAAGRPYRAGGTGLARARVRTIETFPGHGTLRLDEATSLGIGSHKTAIFTTGMGKRLAVFYSSERLRWEVGK